MTDRCNRIAPVYDLSDAPMDLRGGRRRRNRRLAQARGQTLEVGIGTGRNLTLYPPGIELVGIDISTRMLAKARQLAARRSIEARLNIADAHHLPFPDATFDTVTGTCVFCSVADLEEMARVVKPDGQILLLDHVRPRNPIFGWIADRLNPTICHLIGPDINRRTEANAANAGLHMTSIRRNGVWREITARSTESPISTPGAARPNANP